MTPPNFKPHAVQAVKQIIKMSPLKKVPLKKLKKHVSKLAPQASVENAVEALTQRIYELEERIAELESVISIENDDVVISSGRSVLISALTSVEISSTQVKVSATMAETTAPIAKFSSMVQCDTMLSNMVISASYTPGAGNVM